MASVPPPDSASRNAIYIDRDDHLRSQAKKARVTTLPSGKEWPTTLNEFAGKRPVEHLGVLWISADENLEVGRLLGKHAYAQVNDYPPRLNEAHINKLTEEEKASMGGEIPTVSTALVKGMSSVRVKLSVHQSSNSAIPMIRLLLNLTYEDARCFKNRKETYVEVQLRKPAVSDVRCNVYEKGERLPPAVMIVQNLFKRLNHDRRIVIVDFEVAADQATGMIFFDALDFKDFNPDIKALRNRLIKGGKFSVILTDSETIQEEVDAVWKDLQGTANGTALNCYLNNTNPNARLGRFLIKNRDDMSSHRAFSAMTAYPTLRDGLIMKQITLNRQFAHAEVTQMDRQGLNVRIASMPGSPEKRELLLFVDQPLDHRALALNIGSRVLASFRLLNEDDRPDYRWHGKVMGYARRSRVVLLVEQQKNPKTGAWAGRDPSILKTVDLTSQVTPEEIHAAVDGAQMYQVNLKTAIDKHSFDVRTDNLTHLHRIVRSEHMDWRKEWIEYLFTASRLDKVPYIDTIKNLELSEKTVEEFRNELDEEQKPVIDHMRSALGPLILIEGPAGAGKTHISVCLAAAIVKERKAKCPPKAPRRGARVLFVTPTNYNVEELMEQCDEACQEQSHDAIVVRALTESTTQRIVQRVAEESLKANNAPCGDDRAALDSAKDMGAASRAFFEDLLAQIHQEFAFDARVTRRGLELSAAEWILWACRRELDPNDNIVSQTRMAAVLRLRDSIPEDLRSDFADALSDFQRWARDGGGSMAGKHERLLHASKVIWPYLYKATDVVIATPVLAMAQDIAHYLPAEVIVVDEAASLMSADGLVFVRYEKCKCILLSGDQKQPRFHLPAGPEIDEFHAQGELPFMIRLLNEGFPAVQLRTQRRYVEKIADLLNKLFYKYKKIYTHADVPAPTTLVKIWPKLPGAALALVNVTATEALKIPGTESLINLKTAAATWELVLMSLAGGVPECSISVLTPYKGQAMVHTAIANQIALSQGKPCSEISILTYEEARGKQNELVIMDIPNVEGSGFLSMGSRVLSAASRAKNGLIVVADAAAVEKWKEDTPIRKFVMEMMGTNVIPHTVDDETQRWIHAVLPGFTTHE